ncbi:MAG: Ig-like domain repeat protein, partial [Blastocatellia bacterium]
MNKLGKLLLAILLMVVIVSGWVVKTSTKNIKLNDIAKTKDESQETKIKEAYLKLPIHFEENLGQVNDQVSFVHKSQGKTLFLTADEAVFSLAGEKDKPSSAIRMKVKGANKSAKAKSEDKLQSYSNYFIGNDQSKWRTNVAHYGKVRYSDVYKGIDLVYHGNNQILEYDFEVSPQVDPKQIAIEFQGIEKLEIEPNGDLSIKTSNGTLSNHKPIIYQEIDGQKQVIAGNFKLLSNDSVGFEVGDYNPNLPLIIDPPISLTYSTYLGGTGFELGNAIAIDSSGNAYVTGQTFSTNFPTMGAFQSTLVGSSDAFVTKLSPTGSGVYSTYLGGNSGDTGIAIAVDASGSAYITGATISTNFPTMNAFQSTLVGSSDAFVTKLSPTGNSLIYSTYLGSSVQDQGLAIAVDSSGNAYIAGEVRSTTGPISSTNFPTMNAFQSTFGGGNADAFVTKFSSTGNNLVYSTLLGGNNDDQGAGIAVDASGNAYVTGQTFSTNFPTMGAFQSTNAGNADAFVTKLSAMGSSLVYSTYLGGSSSESGSEIAVDTSGNAYITGQTFSTNFPTMNAFQSTFGGGFSDAFITKLSSTGNNIVYSTYLGGSNDDQGAGIAVDSSGNTYITGNTNSTNFPTMNAFQSSLSGTPDPDFGSPTDVFVTQLSATGNSLLNSTYLGGNSDDRGSGIAVDASGNAYVIGQADSTNFPTTMGAFQSTGGGDAFVTKLILVTTTPTITTVTSSPNPSVFGQSVTLTATVTQQSGTTTPTGMVEFFDGSTSLGTATLNASSQASIMTSAIQAGSRSITAMYAGDSNYSASTSAAITQTVNKANTTTAVVSNANPSVFGQSVTFTATVSAVAPGSGTATGMVQFIDGTTNLDSPVSLISGQAQLSISNLSVATHSITAMYLGDSNFNASTSTAINQVVNKANTSSVVTSSLNPSNFNQLVTFTATVRADTPAPGLPTGIVQFKDGANNLGNPVSLDGKGKAQLSTSILTGGSHSITVVYNGDTSFNASTSVIFTQTVNPIASTTTLTVTPTTSVFGQAVSLSATVTGVGGTPTGTIQFKDGVTNLGSPVTLASGSASVQVSTLTTGSHSLTAVYSGDNNFNPSTSAAITQTVNKANTTTAVVSNANPSVFGQTVTFIATVSAVAPGSGTATGMVQFIDGSTNLGSPVSLTSGQAQLSISNLSVATHSITAMYLGDSNFNASTSTAINQ